MSTFSDRENNDFVDAANPHQWYISAVNLNEQANILHKGRGKSYLMERKPNGTQRHWDEADRATFLLCAFALENMIKAFLIYEHPTWIGEGKLSKNLLSHRLSTLSEKSSLLPYKKRDMWVLSAFEEGNESWMRYPCGRRADDIEPAADMHDKLWDGYTRVMQGYEKRMVRLLSKGWNGPYGYYGRWEFSGPAFK